MSYEPVKVFRPQRWRIVLYKVAPPLAFTVATVIPTTIIHVYADSLDWRDRVIYLGYAIVAVWLAAFWAQKGPRDYRIELTATCIKIYNPKYKGSRRSRSQYTYRTIRREHLDRRRTAQRTLSDRLMGRHTIYATNGYRLAVPRYAFDPSDFERLLGLLNIREELV